MLLDGQYGRRSGGGRQWMGATVAVVTAAVIAVVIGGLFRQRAQHAPPEGSEDVAGDRVALVIGNGTYVAGGQLPNAPNDATDIAAVLERLGFAVETVRDVGQGEMNEALRLFARRSEGAAIAVVFYAGHGMEVNGVNYLMPVDAQVETHTDVTYVAIPLEKVLEATDGAAFRLVILDACRNNPLGEGVSRSGTFAQPNNRLLRDEIMVAYSAVAGTTAADGERGGNSPYTEALLEYLEEPVKIQEVFQKVRARVRETTEGKQRTHEYSNLERNHSLASGGGPTATERLFFDTVRDSENAAELEAYKKKFPNGAFLAVVNIRLATLVKADPPGAEHSAWREAGTVFQDCPTCPTMVAIPMGRFRMGCVSEGGCEANEQPVHEVEIASFALGAHEVAFAEYDQFAMATGRHRPDDQGWGRGRRPVIMVSWNDAVAYANWLSQETGFEYRLPSESEWEYAARAGSTTKYSWGQDVGESRANCAGCGSRWDKELTAPAGSFAGNAWGLHDMHGNVLEWVEDCQHEDYAGAPRDGSAWNSGGEECRLRGLRGGAWNYLPRLLRSAGRFRDSAENRRISIGFRVARTLGAP